VNTNFGARFGLKGKRLDRIVRILEMLYQGEILTAPRVSSLLQVPLRTTKSDFQFLRKIELVAFEGPLKVGKYVLTQKGHKAMKELVS
jgi:predicted DNA-binding transcriptional regulator YafY